MTQNNGRCEEVMAQVCQNPECKHVFETRYSAFNERVRCCSIDCSERCYTLLEERINVTMRQFAMTDGMLSKKQWIIDRALSVLEQGCDGAEKIPADNKVENKSC